MLVGGTASAQLVVLLAAPVLTRLYNPDDFGVLAVFMGLLALLSVIASLKYELAIPLPEDESEVVALTLLSLFTVILIAATSGILVFFFGNGLAELLQVPTLADYLWLIPVGVVLAGSYQVFTYWAVRLKEFPLLAKTKLWQQLITVAVQIAAFKAGGVGLLFGQVSGQGVGVSRLASKVVRRDSWKKLPLEKVRYVAVRYRNFPIFSTWAGFLNSAGTQMPPILIASIFGASSAGFYALAHRIIALPMGVLGQAIGQVFLSNAAIDYRAGNLPPLVLSAHRMLVQIILPPVVFLILFGPEAFGIIFGEIWKPSGEVASWLALWMLVSFSTSPLSSIFTVVEKQYLGMLMQALLFGLRVLGIGIGAYYHDFMLGVIWYSILNVIGYIFYQVISFRVVGLSANEVFKSFYVATIVSMLAFLVKIFFDSVGAGFNILLFVIFVIFSILHFHRIYGDYLSKSIS